MQTGGMDAQYNALGGVINVLTMGGSDEFHATASIYANHYKLSRTGVLGSQLYEYSLPFNPDEVGPTQSYQVSINVGGPIVKRKLWFRAHLRPAAGRDLARQAGPAGRRALQHPAPRRRPAPTTWRACGSPTRPPTCTGSGCRPTSRPASFNNTSGGNSRLGVAENHQNQNAIFGVLGWDWFMSGNVNTQLQAGYLYELIETGPQGWLGKIDYTGCDGHVPGPSGVCTYDRNRPQHVNLTDNTTWYNGDAYQNDKR